MYGEWARIYDAIYASVDYPSQARAVERLVKSHKRSSGNRLLDVACGTGLHLSYLQETYEVEGLDLSADMLHIAQERLPGVGLHQGDMADFDLGQQFDVVTCLFSSIAYVRTAERLRGAIASMALHLVPGGVLIVEPFFEPAHWIEGYLGLDCVDLPELKVARMGISGRAGTIGLLNLEYLIGEPGSLLRFSEVHETGLFTVEQHMDAYEVAGLSVEHDPEGLRGRGIYVGVKSTS